MRVPTENYNFFSLNHRPVQLKINHEQSAVVVCNSTVAVFYNKKKSYLIFKIKLK